MSEKKTILIAPNSYKECADSVDAAELFARHLKDDNLRMLISPVSDGGDGFLKVCIKQFDLQVHKYLVSSPFGSQIEVNAGYDPFTETAYIESAEVLGLRRIPREKRNPMHLSSGGLGQLIKKISTEYSVNKFVIGIGGTGTNDLGLGMLSELGLKLFDKNSMITPPLPHNFSNIYSAHWENNFKYQIELVVDVENPLTGTDGSSCIYGPQKGLTPADIGIIDFEFQRLVNLFIRSELIQPGIVLSGAGGGLAAGFQMFLNAEVTTSDGFILEDLKIKEKAGRADFVITGEGAFDEQSLSGKAAGIIIKNTSHPVFLVCGKIKKNLHLPDNIIPIELQKYFKKPGDSIKKFKEAVHYAADEINLYVKNF
jgi:glycerate 2-kinase